jgi:hypothetical protein
LSAQKNAQLFGGVVVSHCNVTTRISLIVPVLLTLLWVGCSKHPSDVTTNREVWKLGVVEISNGVQIQRDLGGKRVCQIMPLVRKDGSVLLNLKLMRDGKLLASPSIQTVSDREVMIRVGDISLDVTPHIKQ